MNINRKVLKSIFIGSLISLFALSFIYLYLIKDSRSKTNYINTLRLDSNPMYEKISSLWPLENEDIEMIKQDLALNESIYTTIIDLNETIIFSNSKTITGSHDKLLLEVLYMDNSYININKSIYKLSQPIYFDDSVKAFVIFERAYDLETNGNTLGKQLTVSMSFLIVFALLVMTAILLFGRNKNELKTIEKGLRDIAKGILQPLPIKKNNDYNEIFNTYNMLIEELTHIMKQQQSYEDRRKAFLTMISHELKTPISTINAYIEGLTSGIAKDDMAKEKYIAIISNKMQQLTTQVEDLFKYAQDDADRFKYNFEECYADELLEKVFSSIVNVERPQTKMKNILPKCIFLADKIRLEQVIMNLYNNAIKHTSKDDEIILKAYREDDDVVIEIEDFGEGISPKDLPYIFDYYYQGQRSKTNDYEGIGLGLAICKSIIDKHNGSMKVKSDPGQGTTMYIKIPLA